MKIELEVNVLNVKDGKLSETFPEEFSWKVLDEHLKAEKMPSHGSVFYFPDSFVIWETTENPFILKYGKSFDDFFSKEIFELFIEQKNWKQVKLSYSSELSLEDASSKE
ncbi:MULTISPECIES: hypothetical protein [unclassified Lactococcus]|uniref:hypothetical protein n=1 Tax=unclassified Lactococcus TaxID=2643510 RepID=UPI0011CA0B51|nr:MULTISPECIES: hypothetical protein [unclassified Lactococcus]MQW23426.1 hypothetical protein [Lactococcus sp. dk101]TXK37062.1 hypothetical protein FVP42_10070 [Lactococcus sp. dk310]TXK37294.1 hypothetical protein FVP42_09300 [Lactococcus sp. dk310]TXK47710.1 hypothetical protein FVP43_09785 [Lactococcus sp. dk322]